MINPAPKSPSTAIASPCVRNCCLDNADICIGCSRTLDEIMGWQSFDTAKRKVVLQRCEERKSKRRF